MKFLYKYPQTKFPYPDLVEENARRGREEKEYQLVDTGVFDGGRYWDVFIETAKEAEDSEELVFRVTAYNRGPAVAPLHILPHVWFRNTWAWGHRDAGERPSIRQVAPLVAQSSHPALGDRFVQLAPSPATDHGDEDVMPDMVFTENETNFQALYGEKNNSPYVKDAFHRLVVGGERKAVNPKRQGSKCAAWYCFGSVPPGDCAVVRLRFSRTVTEHLDEERIDDVIEQRRAEADEFYWRISPLPMSDDLRNVQRQAFSGMLWTKQYYNFVFEQWANGDPATPPPPLDRKHVRNQDWKHLHLDNVLSMPDSWEYPFFATWDTAFHCIPLAMIDPDFAKKQLDLLTREWSMSASGALPAYEWEFSSANPPVHAWAVFRTFKIERKMYGRQDLDFLERVFQKLLLNFTWWVNRKDVEGKNVFDGGFLGLDNISLFNRNEQLPTGGVLEQADSTGWMAFYAICMLNISLELAKHRRIYEDMASKFFEHFVLISDAMSYRNGMSEASLWNEKDGFYYDSISWGAPFSQQIPVRSLVGLIPLYAVTTLEPELINNFPSFQRRMEWFIEHRSALAERNTASMKARGKDKRILLSLVNRERLVRILQKLLDESEFLSDRGIRSLSKHHQDHPFSMDIDGRKYTVEYVPGESRTGMMGGNSSWVGPVWIAVNFLLIESLLRQYMFYGDELTVECPSGSGKLLHLGHVAQELQNRLLKLYSPDDEGRRAVNAGNDAFDFDDDWKDYLHFYEYFDGDTGRGLGASHQCGWTGMLAKIIHDSGLSARLPTMPRTPAAAANRYFDDTFYKNARHGAATANAHHRRSSTHRSIGNKAHPAVPIQVPPGDDKADFDQRIANNAPDYERNRNERPERVFGDEMETLMHSKSHSMLLNSSIGHKEAAEGLDS